jgi:alpha-L-fucosidase
MRVSAALLGAAAAAAVPLPNARQLEFMALEMSQFMHFGLPTFWDPPADFLHTKNPTYHDCTTTSIDRGNQTRGSYPCLRPDLFRPTDLDADDWMRHATAMGMKEICLTAHHEGGFALWPSNFTTYSVAASSWRGGKGDVLREFADAANRWGVKISVERQECLFARISPEDAKRSDPVALGRSRSATTSTSRMTAT